MRGKLSVSQCGVLAAILLTAGAVPARAQERVTASVPFDFFVRSTMLPAGKYTFTEQSDQAIVAVQSADGVNFSFVLTIPESSNDSEAQPELVFDRIGSKYFLVRIVADTDNVRGIPLSDGMKAQTADRVAIALDR